MKVYLVKVICQGKESWASAFLDLELAKDEAKYLVSFPETAAEIYQLAVEASMSFFLARFDS